METTMPEAKKKKKRGTAEIFICSETRWNGTQRKRVGDKAIECEDQNNNMSEKKTRVMKSHLLVALANVDANAQPLDCVRGAWGGANS